MIYSVFVSVEVFVTHISKSAF